MSSSLISFSFKFLNKFHSAIYTSYFINTKRLVMTNANDTIEECKANAARVVVEENINRNCIVGIGSGSTMKYVAESLIRRCKEKNLEIKCIPTSLQAKQLIHDYNLPITDLDQHPNIDVTIDGADEVDENFVAIKGGGACHTQEKVIASAAKDFIIVADYRKNSKQLGDNWDKGIPIEVIPMAQNVVRHRISRMYGVQLEDLVIRLGKEKAGPVITDNGNLIIDWKFRYELLENSSSEQWRTIAEKINNIPGVVEIGLFVDMIKKAYFGQQDGSVMRRILE